MILQGYVWWTLFPPSFAPYSLIVALRVVAWALNHAEQLVSAGLHDRVFSKFITYWPSGGPPQSLGGKNPNIGLTRLTFEFSSSTMRQFDGK